MAAKALQTDNFSELCTVTSLIITTYNRPDALELVLLSIIKQSLLPDEVIIADDGSTAETADLIKKYQVLTSLTIKHAWQENRGFRAARVRNLALAQSLGNYIIYIDGDMVLHPNFVQDHNRYKQAGYFIHGSRVIVNEKETKRRIAQKKISVNPFSSGIKNRLNAVNNKIISQLASHVSEQWNDARSCNMSFWKKDLIAVNGFNETFVGWGREDNEIVVRLFNSGIKRKNIKCAAVAYHLYHPSRQNDQALIKNDQLLNQIVKDKSTWCTKGLDQYL